MMSAPGADKAAVDAKHGDHQNARFGARHFKNRLPYQTKVIHYSEYMDKELGGSNSGERSPYRLSPPATRKAFPKKSLHAAAGDD